MKIRNLLLIAVVSMVALAASAQSSSIVGTWTLTVADKLLPNGTRTSDYGDNPHGLVIFTADGYYSVQIYRSDRLRFSSGDKFNGTPEEYKDASLGMSVHFGRYTLDPAKNTISFKIDRASVPNLDGTTQVRTYVLKGDDLSWQVAARATRNVPSWLLSPQRVWIRRAIFQVHLWVGLIITVYAIIIGLSGSALVFRDEIERTLRPTLYHLAPSSQQTPLAIAIQRIEADRPGWRALSLLDLDHPDQAITLLMTSLHGSPSLNNRNGSNDNDRRMPKLLIVPVFTKLSGIAAVHRWKTSSIRPSLRSSPTLARPKVSRNQRVVGQNFSRLGPSRAERSTFDSAKFGPCPRSPRRG